MEPALRFTTSSPTWAKDDGIEWFGGGFNTTHIVVTGAADDPLDIDEGFRGTLQHVFAQQDLAAGDSLLELCSSKDASHSPVTLPKIANVTLIGSNGSNAALTDSVGVILKEAVTFELFNSIILDLKKEVIAPNSETTAYCRLAATELHPGLSLGFRNDSLFGEAL